MEQRFTFKDFFLFTALGVLLIVLLLSMYMVDRQWSRMAAMQNTLTEQAEDIRSLRTTMQSIDQRIRGGALVAGNDATLTADVKIPPAFQRAYMATQLPDYQSGDWLVNAFGVNLKTITPLVSSDVYAGIVQNFVLDSLLMRDAETLEWIGLIAKDWSISEDGMVFSFIMREDVKFSDGKPLTAEDVAFTFAFIMNEKIAAPRERAYYEKIKSVEARSQYEVVFTFKEPYFNALSLAGSMSILAKHFYEPYLEKPEEFNQSKGLLLGSGPYRLADPKGWTPDIGLVELVRNPRYWGPVLPSFNKLMWKVIENDSARLTTFRNGEIDSYSARPREYHTLLKDKDLVSRTEQLEYMNPIAGYSYIGWNQLKNGKATWFADKRVRQAMTYLTDRDRIIQEIMLGYAEIAISPFSPRSKQHAPDLQARSYDLDKAKQLLADAGFKDSNGDGVLEGPDGKNFEFELVYFQDNEDTKRIVLFLKDLYARAGVLLQPKPTEWSVMIDLLEKKDFDAITLGWSSGVETDIFQMFHSSQRGPRADNFINFKSEKLDKLIEQARATVDEATRMPIWQECERIMHDEQPYTFLMRSKTLAFIDKRIKNVQITNLGLNHTGSSYSFPMEWYVPSAEQKYSR